MACVELSTVSDDLTALYLQLISQVSVLLCHQHLGQGSTTAPEEAQEPWQYSAARSAEPVVAQNASAA